MSLRFIRRYSHIENLNALLDKNDRSSYLLAQYIPEPARNAFLAIRAFALEINRISDGGNNSGSVAARASSHLTAQSGITTADVKLKFWSDTLAKVFSNPYSTEDLGEPIAVVLREALRDDLNLDLAYFHRFLQTRQHFLRTRPGFATAGDICAYGEGTYSQLNYATQALLLSPQISPSVIELLESAPQLQATLSDIAAHIGQATAVSSMLLGLKYYAARRNQVTLPVDSMAKHDVSQEDVLRLAQGHAGNNEADIRAKVKNVVYDTAVVANDHMLTARSKLESVKKEIAEVVRASESDLVARNSTKWRKGVPDVLFTPFMVGIPTGLYLERLEKRDFDVWEDRREWRLAWRSYRNYYKRVI